MVVDALELTAVGDKQVEAHFDGSHGGELDSRGFDLCCHLVAQHIAVQSELVIVQRKARVTRRRLCLRYGLDMRSSVSHLVRCCNRH